MGSVTDNRCVLVHVANYICQHMYPCLDGTSVLHCLAALI